MKRLKKLLLFAVACALALALLEGLCTAWAKSKYGTIDVARLHEARESNDFVGHTLSPYATLLNPHPYLGWVANEQGGANNRGMHGPNYPIKHDDKYFTILFVGGSVADQIVDWGYLEKTLQERLDFGKPVRVLSAAGGGWAQPQQAIALLLYGEIADAVVSLDGFNEHNSLKGALKGNRRRLEMPNNDYILLNPTLDVGTERLAAYWQSQRLKEFSLRHNSRAIFLITEFLRSQIEIPESNTSGRDTLVSQFEMPREWTFEERGAFNVAQYQKYLKLSDALADKLGLKKLHFIQPCPAIGKTLTEEEKRAVGPLDYASSYQSMTDQLVALNQQGVPVVSLLDIFESTPEAVYGDPVHCLKTARGYPIMSNRIADEIAKAWGVKTK